jgi:hypothetical protein
MEKIHFKTYNPYGRSPLAPKKFQRSRSIGTYRTIDHCTHHTLELLGLNIYECKICKKTFELLQGIHPLGRTNAFLYATHENTLSDDLEILPKIPFPIQTKTKKKD